MPTFDAMVHPLHQRMFQPVVTTNCGQCGVSTAQAPYRERYDKVIAHVPGAGQVAVSVLELNLGEGRRVQTLLIFAAGSQRTASMGALRPGAVPEHDSVRDG